MVLKERFTLCSTHIAADYGNQSGWEFIEHTRPMISQLSNISFQKFTKWKKPILIILSMFGHSLLRFATSECTLRAPHYMVEILKFG